ncbi:hypothetical protein BCR41DRAFT_387245 [Lobosporangium transversale]|uniref:Uncharacterized protein n=1 Tax=Lobosporangium transversale TaxID=64571 RepID=A0A1Y2GK84_9FUNG|nr:hypothetical protein BCR41DRAFT_387245 [Lobosporangium transversale]ORZ13430.1 hypothetical protein BCR41DRAFT_387245 [Lobosporangium transversale]|eukprot:XP_021880511.1 hypothetical protein BCR41DRAFT_387245 [Lobosporangium transversale]
MDDSSHPHPSSPPHLIEHLFEGAFDSASPLLPFISSSVSTATSPALSLNPPHPLSPVGSLPVSSPLLSRGNASPTNQEEKCSTIATPALSSISHSPSTTAPAPVITSIPLDRHPTIAVTPNPNELTIKNAIASGLLCSPTRATPGRFISKSLACSELAPNAEVKDANGSTNSGSNSSGAYASSYRSRRVSVEPLSVITKAEAISGAPTSGPPTSTDTGAITPSRVSTTPGTSVTDEPTKELPSKTRFKEIIKRNVGFSYSSPTSSSSSPASAEASTSTSATTSSLLTNSVFPSTAHASSAADSDIVSPEDPQKQQQQQYSQVSSFFNVPRLTSGRKKVVKPDTPSPAIDDSKLMEQKQQQYQESNNEDNESLLTIMRSNPHKHPFRNFIPHLHRHRHWHRHYSPLHRGSDYEQVEERLIREDESKKKKKEKERQKYHQQEQPVVSKSLTPSKALIEARELLSHDPNVLVTELEPLPVDFVKAFTAFKLWKASSSLVPIVPTTAISSSSVLSGSTSAVTKQSTRPILQYQLPMIANKVPSLALASTIPSSGSESMLSTQGTSPTLSATTPVIAPSLAHSRLPRSISEIGSASDLLGSVTAAAGGPLAPRNFLFKSYQDSRFQGHYVFRVLDDTVEYAKLPVSLEQACSQYFREADVNYRALESKAKVWREAKKTAMVKREEEFVEARKIVASLTTTAAISAAAQRIINFRNDSISSCEESSDEEMVEPTSTHDVFDNTEEGKDKGNEGLFSKTTRKPKALLAHNSSPMDGASCNGNSSSNIATSLKNGIDGTDGNGESMVQYGINIMDGGQKAYKRGSTGLSGATHVLPNRNSRPNTDHPSSRLACVAGRSPSSTASHPNSSAATQSASEQDVQQASHLQSVIINEEQQLEEQQREIDDTYWQGVERNHCEEAKQQLYGLEAYLLELVKWVEYEPFDQAINVEILNKSPDTTLFSIVNGDKTNIMRLESPSIKQKEEFLNWISICIMDHDGDGDYDRDMGLVLDITNVRISLLEAALRARREETKKIVDEITYVLKKLEDLDQDSKELAANVVRALDRGEIRAALQPSFINGQILADTVKFKVQDVSERIIVCARIKEAARLNLNRLKYEVELEQRSIRLFRKYKIALTMAILTILGLLWLLYYRHANPTSPLLQPQSITPTFNQPNAPLQSFPTCPANPLRQEKCPLFQQ